MKYLFSSMVLCIVFMTIFSLNTELFARNRKSQNFSTNIYDYKQIDINNISAWITNYGSLFRNPITGNSGLIWPRGSGIQAVYGSGLWMGAKVNNEVRVAVAEYSYEFGPGSIDPITHLPNNPDDPRYVVYKFNKGDMIPQQAIEDGCPNEVWGDQMLWCVYNDADPAYHVIMASPPLGVEIQQTAFAWDTLPGPLENLVILRWLIINRSGQTLDSVYISMWSDPDLGDSGDDLIGCDTTRSLAFCYNGSNVDAEYGIRPPAIGYDFLQGPIVPSPGDSAIFMGEWIPDHNNLPMTSFINFSFDEVDFPSNGSGVYNLMRALWPDGTPLTYGGYGDDQNNPPTNYIYSGDPESKTGWLQDIPYDIRFLMNTGPVTMMPGDSQEVVIGVLVSRGGSNVNSVTKLKQEDQIVQTFYNNFYHIFPPDVSANVKFADANKAEIDILTEIPTANGVAVDLFAYSGTFISTLTLFDDGMHDDENANDGIWGNTISINRQRDAIYLDLNVDYQNGADITWPAIKNNITVAGSVTLPNAIIGADNTNGDGFVNPGEVIRYTLNVQNHSEFDLSNVQIEQLAAVETDYVHDLMTSYPGYKLLHSINNSQTESWNFSPDSIYYQFSLSPNTPPNDSIHIVFRISDNNANVWYDTVAFYIHPFANVPQTNAMNLVQGFTEGRFEYTIFDPALLTGDTYRLNVHEQLYNLVLDLEDYTTDDTLIKNNPFPDKYGFDSPVIDGFKITLGTASKLAFPIDWEWEPSDQRWLELQNQEGQSSSGEVFLGSIFLGGTLNFWEYKTVLIKFDSLLTTNCRVYRRDLGYAVQPGLGTFYGEAYDIHDPNNPRRLNIVFLEDNNYKPADMVWNPDDADQGDREYLFIMNSDYNRITAGGYDDNNWGPSADVLFSYWPSLELGHIFLENPAELKLIVNPQLVHDGDVFEFTPVWKKEPVPGLYVLEQNFPNPFNSGTTIRFSITQNVRVRLEIFNILGQRVKTLINETMIADDHEIKWDGRNESGDRLGSGIYFYRLRAGNFIKTRKMIFLK